MSREQYLRNGAGLMVFGALIFLVYAVVFFFRAFTSSGIRDRCRDVERRYGAATRWAQPGNHGLHHAPTCGHSRVHRRHRDRRWRLSLVRGSRRIMVGVDNGRDRARRGIGHGVATALHGALQLRLGEPPRADLPWDDHLRCGCRGGALRAQPSGARRSANRALVTGLGRRVL